MLRDPVRVATMASGVVLATAGVLLLFFNQVFLDVMTRWWPSLVTVYGSFLLYKVWFRNARAGHLFVGMLLALTGLFILSLNTLVPEPYGLKELWPVFMGIVGLSLIPYGLKFRRTVRVSLVVPGVFLLVLTGVFLLFSLQIVRQSFAEFVISWWPLVLVFFGVALIASGWAGKRE